MNAPLMRDGAVVLKLRVMLTSKMRAWIFFCSSNHEALTWKIYPWPQTWKELGHSEMKLQRSRGEQPSNAGTCRSWGPSPSYTTSCAGELRLNYLHHAASLKNFGPFFQESLNECLAVRGWEELLLFKDLKLQERPDNLTDTSYI